MLSRKYGFSMGSPRGWTAGLDAEDLPVFINFPTSPRAASGKVVLGHDVDGGASLRQHLLCHRREMTMAEWAHFNEQAADRATLVASVLNMPSSTGASNATMVSFDIQRLSPDEQPQHEAHVYWEFRGRLAAYLFFVVGDPKAADYSDLLLKLVRSIRPA